MSVDDRIRSLRSRHGDLEARLREENKRAWPDTGLVGQIKREKLKIKDEIDRLAVAS